MNKTQLDAIAKKLKLDEKQRRACFLHLIAGDSAYAAEKQVYGDVTSTVSRISKRVKAEFDSALEVASLSDCNPESEKEDFAKDAQINYYCTLLESNGFSVEPNALILLQERGLLAEIKI